MSSAWNEYSDNSDNEQASTEPIVSEAVKQLFLRKYSSTNISEEELIKIFQESDYKDNAIQVLINERLQMKRVPYVIVEKPFANLRSNDYEDKMFHDSYYRNNRKGYYKKSSKQSQSGWDDHSYSSSYYKPAFPYKGNNKHHRFGKVKKSGHYYANEVNSNPNLYQIEKEIELSDEGINQVDKEIEEPDLKVSQTFSKVSTVSELSATNESKEKEANPSMSTNSPLPIKRSTSEVISELTPKGDNISFLTNYTNYFFDNSANYVKKEPQLFESKLFPGFFFTKPIEQQEKKKQWKCVYDYYSPMVQPQN